MSVLTRVFNAALFVCATASLTGCPPFEAEPLPDPDQCRPGEQRPDDDGCNTCVCEDDGSWSCTERGCGPVCDPDEVLVDGVCLTGCYSDQDCGEGQTCTADDECLSPPGFGEGDVAPAVCYGACIDEVVDCPAIACPPIECEFGSIIDDSGCDTCQCAPPPMCEPVNCEIACEFGFALDDAGCEICACNPPPMCEPIDCDLDCEFGYAEDERGCGICACDPPPACEPVACDLFCENGFALDDAGCEICVCNPAPVCAPDEVEVDGECRTGCYGADACGLGQTCNAAEICLPPNGGDGRDGDEPGAGAPADPAVCYGYCVDDVEPPVCAEPDAAYYYVGNSVEECSVINFACAEGSEYFGDDCGCGCIGTECYPGDQREAGDGCNTCECTEDGGWACTEIACDVDG